jgi:hypothetical protein
VNNLAILAGIFSVPPGRIYILHNGTYIPFYGTYVPRDGTENISE